MAELSMDRFTDTVINAMGPNTSPRVREVMTALIRHMHDFAREVKLTTEEYLAACDFMVRAGHMSDDKRNEVVLLTDVFGARKPGRLPHPGRRWRTTRRPHSTKAPTPPFSAPSGVRMHRRCPTAPRSCRAALRASPCWCRARILGTRRPADQGCHPQCLGMRAERALRATGPGPTGI